MTRNSKIVRIELHDARIDGIRLRPGGRVDVSFRHVSVFVEDPSQRCFVWSYSGLLELGGVSSLVVSGELSDRDYVSDGLLREPAGKEMELAELIDASGGAGTLELSLAGSGASVKSNFTTCSFAKLEPIKKLEEWRDE